MKLLLANIFCIFLFFAHTCKAGDKEIAKIINAITLEDSLFVGHANIEDSKKSDMDFFKQKEPSAFFKYFMESDPVLNSLIKNKQNRAKHVIGSYIKQPVHDNIALVFLGKFAKDEVQKDMDKFAVFLEDKQQFYYTDIRSCSPTGPLKMEITNDRIIIASSNIFEEIKSRLLNNNAPMANLDNYHKFRKDKFISVAAITDNNEDFFKQNKLALLTFARSQDSVTRALFGLKYQNGLKYDLDLVSNNKIWADNLIYKFEAGFNFFKDKTNIDLFPAIAKLYIQSQVDKLTNGIRISGKIKSDQTKYIRYIPDEIFDYIAEQYNDKIDYGSKYLDEREIPEYIDGMSHDMVGMFKRFKQNFQANQIAGPFGIKQIPNKVINHDLNLNAANIEVQSYIIANKQYDNTNNLPSSSQANIYIDEVIRRVDEDIMHQNNCRLSTKNPTPMHIYHSLIQGKGLQKIFHGQKSFLVKQPFSTFNINHIIGKIEYNLPIKVNTITIDLPFAGQQIETEHFSIKFIQTKPNEIRYIISGKTSYILSIMAIGSNDKYLRKTDNSKSYEYFDQSKKEIRLKFQEEVNKVEISYSLESKKKDYPFKLYFK